MVCAGMSVHSLSPYQRVYIFNSGVTSKGSSRKFITRGKVRGCDTSPHQSFFMAKWSFHYAQRARRVQPLLIVIGSDTAPTLARTDRPDTMPP